MAVLYYLPMLVMVFGLFLSSSAATIPVDDKMLQSSYMPEILNFIPSTLIYTYCSQT